MSTDTGTRRPVAVAVWNELDDRQPAPALVENVDLVIVRSDDDVSVLYGRCLHRGAMMADGHVDGDNIICGVHGWDYRVDTGVSEYNNAERLHRFTAWVEGDTVFVDADEVAAFSSLNPQPFRREEYLGQYVATHGDDAEPKNSTIEHLARHGLERTGHHGPVTSMGVPSTTLPSWDDIQLLPAQLATSPHLEDVEVATALTIGPGAARPLALDIPLFVSDMSFGALSEEAKTALARGAERAGTGICSGEGGMLPEEQAENSRYLYELASARFGFTWDRLDVVQAFHFKLGQGAKTGTGGHLPGHKNVGKIAEVRGLPEGTSAVSPPRFPEFDGPADFEEFAGQVREHTGGIPVGAKLSANHIEQDIDAALDCGVDYIILDGRGGGTGAAPTLFRDHISVPTIPALARARRHLDQRGRSDVTLIITGGLRTAPDFCKAMALGADGIALSNSAMQAVGCQAMRACSTNRCPVGIATQDPKLRARLDVELSAQRLTRFFAASVDLMKVLARACGHDRLADFGMDDLATLDREMAHLAGIRYSGVAL